MKVKSVPSSWIQAAGRRLDVGPYLFGAVEARERIRRLAAPKQALKDLTAGPGGGIFNGPQFSRRWVTDPDLGVPFLGSSSMLLADLSHLPLLSRKYADSPKLRHLEVQPGMTLISCSGTIGRMVYARPDMAGMWASQDIMKVCPDPALIPPGYLYAFLSSRFGVPMVVGGTYGAIIQHIEPEHIAGLPVPRLGEHEGMVNRLIEESARFRSEAVDLLLQSQRNLAKTLGIRAARLIEDYARPLIGAASSRQLQQRSDAFYYCKPNEDSRSALDDFAGPSKSLGQVAEIFIPGIFKRLYADDPALGRPYITGAGVFQLAPTSDRYLLRSVADEYRLIIHDGVILVQEAGQLGGLIGRSVLAGRSIDGWACSNNMVRIAPAVNDDTGYLFALLSSEHGVRLLAREGAGSSIPHTDLGRVQRIEFPWPDQEQRLNIGWPVMEAKRLRDQASALEWEARLMVETVIEGASP